MKYRKSVFIVVYRKEKYLFKKEKIKYLLLKRRLHWSGWEFPKGGVEAKENLFNAVKRELFEETGQISKNIKKDSLFGKYKYKNKLGDRHGIIGQSYVLFSAEVKNKKIIFDKKEHSKFIWLEYDKAIKLLKWNNQKRCLKKVNSILEKK
jgi:8-oxo-dGTP pyrophosphatase MutT (NUDIX family)